MSIIMQAKDAVKNDLLNCAEPCTIVEYSKIHRIDRLDEQLIVRTKININVELKQNQLLRAASKALITCAALITVYKVFIESDEVPRPAYPHGAYEAINAAEVNRRLVHLEDYYQQLNPSWFTWQWCKNWVNHIGKGLFSMVATKGLYDLGENAAHRIFHASDSQWFITARTNFVQTVQEVQDYIHKLEATDDEIIKEHCKYETVCISNAIMKQCALILGFMEYSISNMPKESPDALEAQTLASYLKVCSNDFANNMEDALNNRNESAQLHIQHFAGEFGRTMMSFNRLEHSV